jgi:hypothetical protein
MNTLDYRVSDQNDLSFELLFDGQPLSELIGAKDTPIPFWLFKEGMSQLPPYSPQRGDEVRIVAVCSCGVYGCGRSLCQVVHEEDVVVFRDFEGNLGSEQHLKEYRFSSDNYSHVISEIVKQAIEYRNRPDKRLSR